jgi:branched-chain amino acid transport system permease protein
MILQQLISGFALGSIYAIIALGFVLIYKATEVVNFAQGAMMMVAAYFSSTLLLTLKLPYLLSFGLTLVFAAFLGIVLDRIVFRPLIGYPLFPIVVATLAVAIIIEGVCGLIWGPVTITIPSPFPKDSYHWGNVFIAPVNLWVIICGLALMVFFLIFFRFTTLGTAMRATAEDIRAAYLCGISAKRVFTITWAVSAVVGAIAGMLTVPVLFLWPGLGHVGLKAFPAAVLGGFGSIPGAIVGGLVLGVSEVLASGYLPEGLKDVFAWILMLVILIIRPEGIFGTYEKQKKV